MLQKNEIVNTKAYKDLVNYLTSTDEGRKLGLEIRQKLNGTNRPN